MKNKIFFFYIKTATPLGTLPVLEYNGTAMGQSMAIARFLAKQVNLAGQTAEEEARANMIVDCITDAFSRNYFHQSNYYFNHSFII